MTAPGTGSNDLAKVKNTSLLDRLLADLADDLPTAERLQRLVVALRDEFACSAVVLLQLDGDSLQPQAAVGLDREVLGRRFAVASHPRLAHILAQREPLQFSADSELPDPYDGLLQDSPDKPLPVHDCMGMSLYLEGRAWGALTLDALRPGSFSPALVRRLEHYAPLIEAAVRVGRLESEVRRLRLTRGALAEPALEPGAGILGESPVLHQLLDELKIVADSELPVLLQGETGVGKELFARALHASSPRSRKPLVYVNCAALPETLAESELFGHVRGAFSGAVGERRGKFELADGGTLFLDEVGELPMAIQAKLLRVLQSGQLQRLGSDREHRVDVRLIAATNRDLAAEVRAGRFRADLYHRLSVYPLRVPPLRERGNDILLLAGYFLEQNRPRLGLRSLRLSAEAQAALLGYPWPGNVRELEHLIGRASLKALASSPERPRILTLELDDLGLEQGLHLPETGKSAPARELPKPGIELRTALDDFQRQLIAASLQRHTGNWAAVARELGVDRANLNRLARRLDLK